MIIFKPVYLVLVVVTSQRKLWWHDHGCLLLITLSRFLRSKNEIKQVKLKKTLQQVNMENIYTSTTAFCWRFKQEQQPFFNSNKFGFPRNLFVHYFESRHLKVLYKKCFKILWFCGRNFLLQLLWKSFRIARESHADNGLIIECDISL